MCVHSHPAEVQLGGKIVNQTGLDEIGQMRQQPIEAVVPELIYLGALLEMVVVFSSLIECVFSTCFFMTLPQWSVFN